MEWICTCIEKVMHTHQGTLIVYSETKPQKFPNKEDYAQYQPSSTIHEYLQHPVVGTQVVQSEPVHPDRQLNKQNKTNKQTNKQTTNKTTNKQTTNKQTNKQKRDA